MEPLWLDYLSDSGWLQRDVEITQYSKGVTIPLCNSVMYVRTDLTTVPEAWCDITLLTTHTVIGYCSRCNIDAGYSDDYCLTFFFIFHVLIHV